MLKVGADEEALTKTAATMGMTVRSRSSWTTRA